MAKPIRLNGREAGVIRAIGFSLGIPGGELLERVHMTPEDLVDVVNSLLEVGYLDTSTYKERVTVENYSAEVFEVNPSFVAALKEAMRR